MIKSWLTGHELILAKLWRLKNEQRQIESRISLLWSAKSWIMRQLCSAKVAKMKQLCYTSRAERPSLNYKKRQRTIHFLCKLLKLECKIVCDVLTYVEVANQTQMLNLVSRLWASLRGGPLRSCHHSHVQIRQVRLWHSNPLLSLWTSDSSLIMLKVQPASNLWHQLPNPTKIKKSVLVASVEKRRKRSFQNLTRPCASRSSRRSWTMDLGWLGTTSLACLMSSKHWRRTSSIHSCDQICSLGSGSRREASCCMDHLAMERLWWRKLWLHSASRLSST